MTTDNLAAVLASMRSVGRKRVLIGIPDSTTGRQSGPISNAAIGYIQENGSPEAGIPARPFLVPGVAKAAPRAAAILGDGLRKAMAGDAAAADASLDKAGMLAASSVKATLTAGDGFAPLAPATLAERRRQGARGTKPLIRTGQLRNAITYVVRKTR